ncbi:NAD-dependent epimerase/dehydratase family protein [Chromobacterium sp. IIBBL 290-4]|uniref:NAD-dependent epimerase/dehydratase family protein n=1 Tax=Chromobacterium sp. IIBBL 290-4 TaxID=2953890 RepID=UPI0020B7154D|nr:NAD-dependent epimerase/dehydratase family protein [Chromobacterium sp. IIBBL 290-4]UTH76565.1 NAD-dependent epimerase/dehydratase family protein [Chromobacterium sp. IIBBL 290-4]
MQCLVLGGGGFIGSAICDQLLSNGYGVNVFEHYKTKPYRNFLESENIKWFSGDFHSLDQDIECLDGVETIIHLISTTHPSTSNKDPIFDIESNLINTVKLLSKLEKSSVKRVIFISSGGTVYGEPTYLPIDEKHPTNPIVSYGIVKLAIEKYLLMYCKLFNIKPIILRVSNPYGERQQIGSMQGAIGVFLNKAINDQPIEIWGDGLICRDYIHVRDVAKSVIKAIKYSGNASIFNISSGSGVTLTDLALAIEKALGRKITVNYLEQRSFDVKSNILCNKLAKTELLWQPEIAIEDGIKSTMAWVVGSN